MVNAPGLFRRVRRYARNATATTTTMTTAATMRDVRGIGGGHHRRDRATCVLRNPRRTCGGSLHPAKRAAAAPGGVTVINGLIAPLMVYDGGGRPVLHCGSTRVAPKESVNTTDNPAQQ